MTGEELKAIRERDVSKYVRYHSRDQVNKDRRALLDHIDEMAHDIEILTNGSLLVIRDLRIEIAVLTSTNESLRRRLSSD